MSCPGSTASMDAAENPSTQWPPFRQASGRTTSKVEHTARCRRHGQAADVFTERRGRAFFGSVSAPVRIPSSALRTISSAGSFGLLRCSMSASVRDSAGLNGRTMKSDMCAATATSGTMAMPRFDATALFNASTVPRGMGSRVRGACPSKPPDDERVSRAALLLHQQIVLRNIAGRNHVGNVPRTGGKYRQHFLRAKRRRLELLFLDRQIHQREIDPVTYDVVDAGLRWRIGDDQIDAGMIEAYFAQDWRQSVYH